jgi:ABC-type phosphate transport system permease subunit
MRKLATHVCAAVGLVLLLLTFAVVSVLEWLEKPND